MRPASGTTVQNPILSQVLTEYAEEARTRMIGTQILPIFRVPDKAGDIMIKRREELLGDQLDTARAEGGTYNRAAWAFERTSYSCAEHGLEYPLDDSEVARYSQYMDIRETNAKVAVDNMLKAQENRIEAELFNATTFSGYTSAITNEWNDATNATPKADVKVATDAITSATGMFANTLVISKVAFDNLLLTDEIVNKLQYVRPLHFETMEAQKAMLETYFGLNILVGGAYYNANQEGGSASVTAVWDDEYALVCKISSSPAEPGIGWTLLWTGDAPTPLVAESYEEPQTRSNVYRVRTHLQENVFAAEYGYLLSNVTS